MSGFRIQINEMIKSDRKYIQIFINLIKTVTTFMHVGLTF